MQPVQWLTLCDSWHWDLSQVGLIFDVPYSIFDRIKSNTSATLQLHASLHMSKFTRRAYSKFELGLVAESLTKLRKCHMSYVDILLNFCQICLTNRCKLAWSCSVAVLDLRSNIDYRTSNINPLKIICNGFVLFKVNSSSFAFQTHLLIVQHPTFTGTSRKWTNV